MLGFEGFLLAVAGGSHGNRSEVVTFVWVLQVEGMCFLDLAGEGFIFCVFVLPAATG